MNSDYINQYLNVNAHYFEKGALPYVAGALSDLRAENAAALASLRFYGPGVILASSLLGGTLGIDRFLSGDIGMGFLKLFTFGGFGIVTVYDWFTSYGRAKRKNYDQLMNFMAYVNEGTYTPHCHSLNEKFCPFCGAPVKQTDDFCSSCGRKLR